MNSALISLIDIDNTTATNIKKKTLFRSRHISYIEKQAKRIIERRVRNKKIIAWRKRTRKIIKFWDDEDNSQRLNNKRIVIDLCDDEKEEKSIKRRTGKRHKRRINYSELSDDEDIHIRDDIKKDPDYMNVDSDSDDDMNAIATPTRLYETNEAAPGSIKQNHHRIIYNSLSNDMKTGAAHIYLDARNMRTTHDLISYGIPAPMLHAVSYKECHLMEQKRDNNGILYTDKGVSVYNFDIMEDIFDEFPETLFGILYLDTQEGFPKKYHKKRQKYDDFFKKLLRTTINRFNVGSVFAYTCVKVYRRGGKNYHNEPRVIGQSIMNYFTQYGYQMQFTQYPYEYRNSSQPMFFMCMKCVGKSY